MTAPIDWVVLTAAATTGLLGGAHCVAMCGGIATSFSAMRPKQAFSTAVVVNLGRISGYALAGLVVGWLGGGLLKAFRLPWLGIGARVLLGVLLVLMALRLLNQGNKLSFLSKPAQAVWQTLKPLHERLLPADSLGKLFVLGMLWGWLPCGLSTTMLATAWLQADPMLSALTMLTFGLATLVVMLPITYAGVRLSAWVQYKNLQRVGGTLLLLAGLITLATPWLMTIPALHGVLGALGCLP